MSKSKSRCSSKDFDVDADNEAFATKFFSEWTTEQLVETYQERKGNLTDLCKEFMLICNSGIKPGKLSVYLSNDEMMETLRGYDEWSRLIFPGPVGLHFKFKHNSGILSHIVKCVDKYHDDGKFKEELDSKIVETTEFNDLHDLLNDGEDAKYLATKANQRPSKAVIAIFDELFDFNGNEKFRTLMRYRFFGTTLPNDEIIDIFLNYDSRINSSLSDKDKVYLPLVKVQRKIFYEFKKYGFKVTSKKVAYDVNWESADTLEESMNMIISGLKEAKVRYRGNNARNGGGGRGRKGKAGRKKKEEQTDDEGETDDEEDSDDEEETDVEEETDDEEETEDDELDAAYAYEAEEKSSQEISAEPTNANHDKEIRLEDDEGVDDEGVDDDDGDMSGGIDAKAGKDGNGVENDGQQHNHNQSNPSTHFREELKINIDDEEHVHEHEQQQINENPDQRVDECRHQIQSKTWPTKASSAPPHRLNSRKRGREQLSSIPLEPAMTTTRIFCYEPSECAPIEEPSRKRRRLSHNHNIKESKEESKEQCGSIGALLLARQEARMKESSLVVLDLAKELHFVSMQPLPILLYVIGQLVAVPGFVRSCKFGYLSFKPVQLDRDDLLTIVKAHNRLDDTDLKTIIDILASQLTEDNFIKIGKLMQKFISTKNKKGSTVDKALLRKIENLELSATELRKSTKIGILKLWFSDVINGPIFITRSLDYIEFGGAKGISASELGCGVVNKLKGRLSGRCVAFWQRRMNYVIVMDKNYFCISGAANEAMNYPLQVWSRYSYIGLRDFATNRYYRVKERVVEFYQWHYLEGHNEEPCTGYRMVAVKNNQGKYRLKLDYGAKVFYGMMTALMREVNSLRFDLWCTAAAGVGWTLWSGLDEQNKLKDYRHLNQRNKKLERQVLELEAALRDKKR